MIDFKYYLLIFWVGSLYSIAQPQTDPHIVATFGRDSITKEQVFDEMLQKYPKEVQEIIQEIMVYAIIRQEGTAEEILVPVEKIQEKAKQELYEFQQQIAQPWQDYVKLHNINEKKWREKLLKKWKYNLYMEQLVRLAELRQTYILVRHILTDTRPKAEMILQKLRQSSNVSEIFLTLVQQESLSETRFNKGELPKIYVGDFEPEVEKVLFQLKPKEISNVVQSSFGFHIFQMLQIIPGQPKANWKELKTKIGDSLQEKPVTAHDFQRWLRWMEKKYTLQNHYSFSNEKK